MRQIKITSKNIKRNLTGRPAVRPLLLLLLVTAALYVSAKSVTAMAADADAPVYTITNNAPNVSVKSSAREGETVFVYCKDEEQFFTATDANGNNLTINGPNDLEMLINGNSDGTFDGWSQTSDSGMGIQDDGDGGYGWANSWWLATLSQTVNVVDMGISTDLIDTGKFLFTASGQMRAPWASGDCSVKIHMLNEFARTIGTVTVLDDKGEYANWQSFSKEFALTRGTRQIVYEVEGRSAKNWEGYYGPQFRRLSLTTQGYTFVMPASNVTINPYRYSITNKAPIGSLSVKSRAMKDETVFVFCNGKVRSVTATDANGNNLTINGPNDLEMLINGNSDGTFDGWSQTSDSGMGIQDDGDGGYGWANSWWLATLSQTVNVVDMGISTDLIDTGKFLFTASGQMRAPWASGDCSVKIHMLNEFARTIGTVTVLDDKGEYANWQSFSKEFALTRGTRQIVYEVEGRSAKNWEGYYGPQFRRLSLTTQGYTFVMPASNVTINPYRYSITNKAPIGSLSVKSRAMKDETVFVFCNEKIGSVTATDANGNDLTIYGPNDLEMLTNGNFNGTYDGWTSPSGFGGVFQDDSDGGYEWVTSFGFAELSQTVNVVDKGISTDLIDTGDFIFTASGQMRAPWASRVCRVKIYMLDAGGNTLETVTVLDDKGKYDDWQSFSKVFALAKGTRQVKYEVEGRDALDWAGYYGPHFRRLSLTTKGYTFVMPASNVTISAEPQEESTNIVELSENDKPKSGIRYNVMGQRVDENYRGIVIEDGKKYIVR